MQFDRFTVTQQGGAPSSNPARLRQEIFVEALAAASAAK
jgi:hypothetical protein